MRKKSSGTKAQRQNQNVRRLSMKIKKFKAKGKSTVGLEKELGYCMGEDRPTFKTGRVADARIRTRKYEG